VSLRKSPTLTPARLEANRRNARKSTGPRTAQGKAQSRLNGLRTGDHSRFYRAATKALLWAEPCSVDAVAKAILTPEQARHPKFAELVEIFREAEAGVAWGVRSLRSDRVRKPLESGPSKA